MNLILKTTTNTEDAADYAASSILQQLKSGKRVLLFLAGGSAIFVAVKIASILRKHPHQNLIVTSTDERYGLIGHADSNWQQLLNQGFNLPQAKVIRVLGGKSRDATVLQFNANLDTELKLADYRIGLFGVGADGHTAGILPESPAVFSEDLICGYEAPNFFRITITKKAIEKLDEAVLWAQGEKKWPVLEDLKKEISVSKQPAQILKKVPIFTIFSDYFTE